MEINLIHNLGFRWFNENGLFVKGYLIDKEGYFYADDKIISYFKDIGSFEEFNERLKNANGLYSVIIKNDENTFAAVDRIRMFPIFYNSKGISDESKSISSDISFDENARADFLQTGYVTSSRTLLKEVSQIQAGEAICIQNGELKTEFYSSFTASKINQKTYPELESELRLKMESAFNIILNQLKGKTIIVPLSAGYDSRLIAVMLKNAGFEKVICFTYGRKNYPEIKTSKAVADRLGFQWYYIEYNQKLINGFLKDKEFQEFYNYSANHVSMFFLQEYFAIKQLKEKNLIPEDAVFISGHSGDFIAGSHLEGKVKPNSSKRKAASEIFRRNFGLLPYTAEYKKNKTKEIKSSLQKFTSLSHGLYEQWDLIERQAKFIVNSCNTYNFFGHQHYLPYWDKNLMDFFSHLPYELKLNKKLFDDVLMSFFEPHQLNFENEFQPGKLQLKIQEQKNKIKKFIPNKLFQQRFLQNDPLCYWEASREMIKDMEERAFPVNHQYKEFKAVFTQWYLSKLPSDRVC